MRQRYGKQSTFKIRTVSYSVYLVGYPVWAMIAMVSPQVSCSVRCHPQWVNHLDGHTISLFVTFVKTRPGIFKIIWLK